MGFRFRSSKVCILLIIIQLVVLLCTYLQGNRITNAITHLFIRRRNAAAAKHKDIPYQKTRMVPDLSSTAAVEDFNLPRPGIYTPSGSPDQKQTTERKPKHNRETCHRSENLEAPAMIEWNEPPLEPTAIDCVKYINTLIPIQGERLRVSHPWKLPSHKS